VHGSAMRGLRIEIDPGLLAVLGPGLLQEFDLVRRRDAEAFQSKDGRSHRDAPRALDHGFVTAPAEPLRSSRVEGSANSESPSACCPVDHAVR